MKKQPATYLIEARLADGSFWNYFQEADSVKKAIEAFNCYKSSDEEIVAVYKKLAGWK